MTSLIPFPTSYLTVALLSCVVLNAGCGKLAKPGVVKGATKVVEDIAVHAAGIVVGETLKEGLTGSEPKEPTPVAPTPHQPAEAIKYLQFADELHTWDNYKHFPFELDRDADAVVRLKSTPFLGPDAMILSDFGYQSFLTILDTYGFEKFISGQALSIYPVCLRKGDGSSESSRLNRGRYHLVIVNGWHVSTPFSVTIEYEPAIKIAMQ